MGAKIGLRIETGLWLGLETRLEGGSRASPHKILEEQGTSNYHRYLRALQICGNCEIAIANLDELDFP